MTFPVRSSVVLAALALAVSGCAGSDGSSGAAKPAATKTSSVAPATGDTVTGTGYSYLAPKGWRPPSQKIPGFDPDSLVGDSADKDGFTDNLNVIRVDPAPTDDADALESAAEKELKTARATGIKVLPQQQVDGTPAVHLTSGFSQNSVNYLVDQFSMIHGKVVYTITFSFSSTVPPERQDSVAQSVLTTWKWAS